MRQEEIQYELGPRHQGRGLVLLPDSPASPKAMVVLGHGAAGGMNHPLLRFFRAGLADAGIACLSFNFPYAHAGRKSPDPQKRLEEAFDVVVTIARSFDLPRLFVGGKSLGGRIAAQRVAEGLNAHGLIFLGYPLHAPGQKTSPRVSHFREIESPMLFIGGTRDSLCDLPTLSSEVLDGRAERELYRIEGGDHSLALKGRKTGEQQRAWVEALGRTVSWIEQI